MTFPAFTISEFQMIRTLILVTVVVAVSSAMPKEACAQQVQQFFSRVPPTGTMSQRFPYQAWKMYYYRRPYNMHHVSGHMQSSLLNQTNGSLPTNSYSNQVFQQIHQNVGFESDEFGDRQRLLEDGYLEYVDWQHHRDRRLEWANFGPRPKDFIPIQNTEFQFKTLGPLGPGESAPGELDPNESVEVTRPDFEPSESSGQMENQSSRQRRNEIETATTNVESRFNSLEMTDLPRTSGFDVSRAENTDQKEVSNDFWPTEQSNLANGQGSVNGR